eukprot:scaffold98895_cov66-Phaeocystis_antarctica.AAC.1
MGAEAGLIMSSRCALPFPDDGGAAFRVFPVGGPNQGRQGRGPRAVLGCRGPSTPPFMLLYVVYPYRAV